MFVEVITTCWRCVDLGICWKDGQSENVSVSRETALTADQTVYKEREVASQATLVIDPALRLERIRLGVDFWISRDGPDEVTIRHIVS
jgi:hypothetical protein